MARRKAVVSEVQVVEQEAEMPDLIRVQSLTGVKIALHDHDPLHPPSVEHPQGGIAAIDVPGRVYIVHRNARMQQAIADRKIAFLGECTPGQYKEYLAGLREAWQARAERKLEMERQLGDVASLHKVNTEALTEVARLGKIVADLEEERAELLASKNEEE